MANVPRHGPLYFEELTTEWYEMAEKAADEELRTSAFYRLALDVLPNGVAPIPRVLTAIERIAVANGRECPEWVTQCRVEGYSDDGTEKLCQALYGRKATATDCVGGSEAPMLHDAAAVINSARSSLAMATGPHSPLSDIAKAVVRGFFIDAFKPESLRKDENNEATADTAAPGPATEL